LWPPIVRQKGRNYPFNGHTTPVITVMFSGFYTLAQALMYSDLHTTPLNGSKSLKKLKNFLRFSKPFLMVFGGFGISLGGMTALPHLGFHEFIAAA
jgi:predicted MPP superfamily phosphohydrolase